MILLPEDPPLRKFVVTLMSGELIELSAHGARSNPTGALDLVHIVGGEIWLSAMFASGTWIWVGVSTPTRDEVLVIQQHNEEHQIRLAQLAAQTQPEQKPNKRPIVH